MRYSFLIGSRVLISYFTHALHMHIGELVTRTCDFNVMSILEELRVHRLLTTNKRPSRFLDYRLFRITSERQTCNSEHF